MILSEVGVVSTTPTTMQRLALRTFFRGAHWRSYAQLSHRALVEVTGADGRHLLQGLVTADVLHATPLLAQYTMFLNAQVSQWAGYLHCGLY